MDDKEITEVYSMDMTGEMQEYFGTPRGSVEVNNGQKWLQVDNIFKRQR